MVIIVSITLLVVAGFGIYNIMTMNVISKMKDIAILKATGFDGKDIISIFLIQSIPMQVPNHVYFQQLSMQLYIR